MAEPSAPTAGASFQFHALRDRLLGEAHARPPTPLPHPTLATRVASLSGEGGAEADRAHMVALCRRLQAPEPAENARWCVVDAGKWRLRWERHTEVSTWTFFRPIADDHAPALSETALDLAPQDWLSNFPGEVLVAAHVVLLHADDEAARPLDEEDVAVDAAGGAARIWTDFRPGPDSFTRFEVVMKRPDAVAAGRIVQRLFEIETYRLLALLGFPAATEAAGVLSRLEEEAEQAARQVAGEGDITDDRDLLSRLARLAGEAQALAAKTNFRFSASQAYYGLMLERVGQMRESRIDTRPTIGEFMERRLAPAMRTCTAVAKRQEALIGHIGHSTQLLSTRVGVATEATNADLLASMDRRAKLQLRLQQTVEGLSVAAISYYSVGLLAYVVKAAASVWPSISATKTLGFLAPAVIVLVWIALRALKRHMLSESQPPSAQT